MKLLRSSSLASLALAVVTATVLAGCGSTRIYPNQGPANLVIRSKVEAREGLLSSAAVALHVHRVESRCKTSYEGMVLLDAPETRVALAPDQPVLLVFTFASKDFVSGGGSVRHDVLLVARSGFAYTGDVSYVRGIYDVVLREGRPGMGPGRVIEARPLPPC